MDICKCHVRPPPSTGPEIGSVSIYEKFTRLLRYGIRRACGDFRVETAQSMYARSIVMYLFDDQYLMVVKIGLLYVDADVEEAQVRAVRLLLGKVPHKSKVLYYCPLWLVHTNLEGQTNT